MIVPLWTTRQEADTGFFPVGGNEHTFPGQPNRKVLIQWPKNLHVYGEPPLVLYYWHGTLLDGKHDKAGTMYRRNRVYDPATGRFTQQDPIGLAGGMNLYGFAGGDPVNFSDPFGLFACPPDCPDNCDGLGWARYAGALLKPAQRPLEIAGALATAPLMASGEAAMTTLNLSRAFYRGVDAVEAADFAAHGVLRASPNGNTGKFLTNSVEAASRWGAKWAGDGGHQVLRVRVPADATKVFEALGRIDGIGQAWHAPMEALNGAKVDVIKNLLTPVPK